MTLLHMPNGNCVSALQPAPSDLFVVTLLQGTVVRLGPAGDYESMLRQAESFAEMPSLSNDSSFTIKVFGVSLAELLLLKNISREDFSRYCAADDAELRALAEQTCKRVLRDSQDSAARRDAYNLLVSMGVLAQ